MKGVTVVILVFTIFHYCSNGLSLKAFYRRACGACVGVALLNPFAASASSIVGEFATSGFIFKDTLKVEKFEDPKISGVTLYLTDFERPINEKLSADFFNDPASTSLTCARTKDVITISKDVTRGKEGEEVFEENKNLFFKTVRVRRILDESTNTLLYVSYSTRLDKGGDANKSRFKSSVCAVHFE